MNCQRCGAGLPAGAAFCGQCGTPAPGGNSPFSPPNAPVAGAPPAGVPAPPAAAQAPVPPIVPGAFAPVTVSIVEPVGGPAVDGAPPRRRGRRWILVVACAVLALGALGVVGLLLLRSDDAAAGGASSPEGAVTGFADALSQEDLLGAATFVSPDELPELGDLVQVVRDAAKAEGLAGLTAGEGLDLQIDLRVGQVDELADDARRVAVSVDLTVSGTPAGPVGELLHGTVSIKDRDISDALGRALDLDRPDLALVVVKEHGKWFVSPLLTAGDQLADALDLPKGDYQAIAQDDTTTVSDVPAAFDQLADAISDRDVDRLAGVVGPGEARFVRVFSRAIEDLVDRAPDGNLDVGGVDVEEVATDRWALRAADITWENSYGDSDGLEVDDGCVRDPDSEGRLCLDTLWPVTSALDSDRLIVHTLDVDGGQRIELAATLLDYLGQYATRTSRATLLSALDLEQFDTPVASASAGPAELTFDGQPYQVVDLQVTGERPYLSEVTGDADVWVDVYEQVDGEWEWSDSASTGRGVLQPFAADGTVRFVVHAYSEDCDGNVCDYATGSTELRFQRLQVLDMPVNATLKPKVGAGGSILVDVPTDIDHRYEISTSTPGATIELWDYWLGEVPVDSDGYYVPTFDGTTSLLLTNTGSSEVTVELRVVEHDPAAPVAGFETGDSITVDLSSGYVSTPLTVPTAGHATITASPQNGQDVVIDVENCSGCLVDYAGSGGDEVLDVDFSDGGQYNVIITGYSTSDDYGEVVLSVVLS